MTGRLVRLPLLLLAAWAATPALATPPAQGVPLKPCQLAHPVAAARVPALCGRIEVPEDPARPAGRRISLKVAVLPADAPAAAPDAVFVLAGGPGQSITEVFPQIAPSFDRLRRDRDIVLVDQRGTGGSGKLACPSTDSAAWDLDARPGELAEEVRRCVRALDVDLTRYGTSAFVADLDAVRAALGYPRVNLVGFSYGTRAALAYARRHPDRTRTLVLDGVAPPEMRVGEEFDEDAERALQALFRRCKDDPACRQRHPDLAGDLRALIARLDATPAKVALRHPLTGERMEMRLDGNGVRQVVMAFLYSPETAALLPPLLAQARDGDLAPLAAQSLTAIADVEAGLSRPLQLSVLCAEDVPFYRDPRPQAAATFLGSTSRDTFRALCAAWPRAPADPSLRDPSPLPVPALLLSGEDDPVTPPRWAEQAARSMPAARHAVGPGMGHGIFMRGCVPRLVAEFVKAASAQGLDLSCVARLHAPPPFVDLQGGSP